MVFFDPSLYFKPFWKLFACIIQTKLPTLGKLKSVTDSNRLLSQFATGLLLCHCNREGLFYREMVKLFAVSHYLFIFIKLSSVGRLRYWFCSHIARRQRVAGIAPKNLCSRKPRLFTFNTLTFQWLYHIRRWYLIFVRNWVNFFPDLSQLFCLALPGSCLTRYAKINSHLYLLDADFQNQNCLVHEQQMDTGWKLKNHCETLLCWRTFGYFAYPSYTRLGCYLEKRFC